MYGMCVYGGVGLAHDDFFIITTILVLRTSIRNANTCSFTNFRDNI